MGLLRVRESMIKNELKSVYKNKRTMIILLIMREAVWLRKIQPERILLVKEAPHTIIREVKDGHSMTVTGLYS